jgi:type IV pilus assembly protein PilA
MLHKLRTRITEEKGFTLIELLVVILIIGILAAIALPSFLGQRAKAEDAQAKTAARTAATAMEARYTDQRNYAGVTAAVLRDIEPSLNDPPAAGNGLAVVPGAGATPQNYTVTVTSTTGGTFSVNHNAQTGLTTRTCTRPAGSGGRTGCVVNGNGNAGTW